MLFRSCMDRGTTETKIRKRGGRLQIFQKEKLEHTIKALSYHLDTTFMDVPRVVNDVAVGVTEQMTSHALQMLAATTAASFSAQHPDYGRLAGRLVAADIHKTVDKSFVAWVDSYADVFGLHPAVVEAVAHHGKKLDDALVHSRDFDMTYMSISSMMFRYLGTVNDVVSERPQFLYMRLALALHGLDIDSVLETYNVLSRGLYTHATPVLFNAGTRKANFASCFLYQPDASSPTSLLQSVYDIDALWRAEGGVGLSLCSVPAQSVFPMGNPGVMAFIRVLESHASFLASSGLRRPCAATIYLPIWHIEVCAFSMCRCSRMSAAVRGSAIRPALWIPDIFMRRLQTDTAWSLFDPADVDDLNDVYGEEFDARYEAYERSDIHREPIQPSVLFRLICDAQKETGSPFLMYQEAANGKNNQQHIGVIRTSNLCTEIVQFSSPQETAVCSLASVALPRFVKADLSFDFEGLHKVVKLAVRNLDITLDLADYPSDEARLSVSRTRPIALGVQGFADCLRVCGWGYGSAEARDFNVFVFETIYHAALEASCELAREYGPYPEWDGSPASKGILQHDLWKASTSGRYDFSVLSARIVTIGLRNSVITAQMPTASTAHLLGNSEGTDPRVSNIVTHRVLSGEYTELCPRLVQDLVDIGMWTPAVRSDLIRNHGSVAGIPGIPDKLKRVYQTVWEIDPRVLIDLAIARGPFIDQSQSLSLYIEWPETSLLIELQQHAWRGGLKTGIYYLRCRPPTFPLPYGVTGAPVFPPIASVDHGRVPFKRPGTVFLGDATFRTIERPRIATAIGADFAVAQPQGRTIEPQSVVDVTTHNAPSSSTIPTEHLCTSGDGDAGDTRAHSPSMPSLSISVEGVDSMTLVSSGVFWVEDPATDALRIPAVHLPIGGLSVVDGSPVASSCASVVGVEAGDVPPSGPIDVGYDLPLDVAPSATANDEEQTSLPLDVDDETDQLPPLESAASSHSDCTTPPMFIPSSGTSDLSLQLDWERVVGNARFDHVEGCRQNCEACDG